MSTPIENCNELAELLCEVCLVLETLGETKVHSNSSVEVHDGFGWVWVRESEFGAISEGEAVLREVAYFASYDRVSFEVGNVKIWAMVSTNLAIRAPSTAAEIESV